MSSFLDKKSARVDFLSLMRSVVEHERDGLTALAASFDESLVSCLTFLQKCRGRVIITGIGKSGHIARKIAATFSSTGTPSYFVHPAEAAHGDLGMICPDDVVLAFSYSGKSQELMSIVSYLRRHDIPLIAVCGVRAARSLFCRSAAATVLLPNIIEACPHNLAPTTSTTMMLALGDALALALLRWRGFSAEDFMGFHPGGGLGARWQTVEQLMHQGDAVPLVRADILMRDALLVMTSKHFGCLGVIDKQDHLIGVITDGDLRRHMAESVLSQTAESVMTKTPTTIEPNVLASAALRLMNQAKITSLFVLRPNERRVLGILHIHDCLRAGIY